MQSNAFDNFLSYVQAWLDKNNKYQSAHHYRQRSHWVWPASVVSITMASSAVLTGCATTNVTPQRILRGILNPVSWQCQNYVEWVRAAPPGAPAVGASLPNTPRRGGPASFSTLDPRTAFLLSDEVFSKYFGKTYEQLTVQDFRNYQRVAPNCQRAGEFTPAELLLVRSLWNEGTHQSTVMAIHEQRRRLDAVQQQTAQASRDLQQLTGELLRPERRQLTLARLQSIRENGRAISPRASADARQAFEDAYRSAVQDIVPNLLRQQAQEVLGQATHPEHLPDLVKFQAQLAKREPWGVSIPEGDPVLKALKQRERELTLAAVAIERRQIDALPDGLPGLEAGAQWHRAFESRWGPRATSYGPELGQVGTDFLQRRDALMGRSGGLLQSAVLRSKTIAEAQSSIDRYTMPSEAQHPNVQAMRAAIDQRIRALERSEALGRPSDGSAGNAQLPAKISAGAAPVAPKTAATVSAEPSEEAMYDLVRMKFEKAAERHRGLYEQCEGGGSGGNPMNAVMCLAINLQGGLTGGALARPVKIVRFSKIGCEKSPSRPGYNCEYEIKTDNPMTKQYESLVGFKVDEAGFGQARFVRNREGNSWIMITGE